jgi:cytochrome c-type biogenesis protein CcmE
MPYRAGLEGLEKRMLALRDQLAEIDEAVDRRKAVEHELAELRLAIDAVHRDRVPPVLRAPRIPTPCEVPWDSMAGDATVRFCSRCSKHVYNLSALTRAEAAQVLEREAGACIRYYERPDGTLLTSDCPMGRAKRRARRTLMGAAFGAALAGPAAVPLVASYAGWEGHSAVDTKSVDDLLADRKTFEGRVVRVDGTLVHGSLHVGSGGEPTRLVLSSHGVSMRVTYPAAVVPDTLRDEPDTELTVMAEGRLLEDGDFLATSVLAKAPSGSK